MDYIYRELLGKIKWYLHSDIDGALSKGVILSGVVGCGKTTLVQRVLNDLSSEFKVFHFSGDDIQFRNKIAEDSFYLLKMIRSQTQSRALIFVDEVQKSEAVFDALKVAFDSKQCSFIVSGSNPAFLSSVAKKRLQRRAYHFQMLPLSISEILVAKGIVSNSSQSIFTNFILNFNSNEPPKLIDEKQWNLNLSLNSEIQTICHTFFNYGGLPLSYLSKSSMEKLMEIRLTVERGFELFDTANDFLGEKVQLELAQLQSQEFTYKNIMEKTRTRNRDAINDTINELINHGYLVKKKPLLLKDGKSSYLSIYSYIDPGIATYLLGNTPSDNEIGFWLEGYIHARLNNIIQNAPLVTELGYYKDHTIDSNGKTKFLNQDEIDFVLIRGRNILPIEVKINSDMNAINTSFLEKFISKKKLPFGIVIYGGVPQFNKSKKILYWPYWLI